MTFKPDILMVIEGEGLELRQREKSFWGLCPFHSEKTPSFSVNRKKQVFYCFGCQKGGDVIQFVRDLRGLSFIEALSYLNLDRSKPAVDPREQERKQAIRAFNQWVKDKGNELLDDLRTISWGLMEIKNLESRAELIGIKDELEYFVDLLLNGDDENRFKFFMEEMNIV